MRSAMAGLAFLRGRWRFLLALLALAGVIAIAVTSGFAGGDHASAVLSGGFSGDAAKTLVCLGSISHSYSGVLISELQYVRAKRTHMHAYAKPECRLARRCAHICVPLFVHGHVQSYSCTYICTQTGVSGHVRTRTQRHKHTHSCTRSHDAHITTHT